MNVVALHAEPASRAQAQEPVHFIGRLAGFRADGRILVEDEAGATWTCRRAASCLLVPRIGDTVMLSGPDRLRVYLIAVIEQADPSASRIEAAGDLTLATTRGGNVSIESEADLCLHGTAMLQMQAERAEARFTHSRLTSEAADATIGHLRLVGKVFESVADRVVQMARNALRLVEETDRARVGHLDQEATGTVRLHGQHTVVTGQELVKVDAAQIHMG